MRAARGIIALDDGADLLHGLLHGNALADEDTGAAVTGVHGRAGDDQVAHTGQTGEGLAVRAERHAQPGDLGKAARHEQGLGVVAVAHAVADTGAEGDDVFECRAQLDTGRVRAGVDAETAAHEGVLHALGKLPLRAGDDNARRDAAADLLGVRGAGQGDDGAAGLLRDKLRHAVAGTLLDALRHGDEQGRFGKVRRKGAGRGAHGERRRGEHDHLPALRAGGVGGIMQSLRQRDAGEIWILMGLGELLALRLKVVYYRNGMPISFMGTDPIGKRSLQQPLSLVYGSPVCRNRHCFFISFPSTASDR